MTIRITWIDPYVVTGLTGFDVAPCGVLGF